MDNMIDWNGKLEAVNAITGEVQSVVNANTTKRGDNIWIVDLDRLVLSFYGDGTGRSHEWRIRNVAEAKAVEAPETHRQGTNGVRTGVEALERYEAFLRRLASGLVGNAEAVAEAKALLPVDPDIQIARDIIADAYEAGDNVSAQHRSEWADYCRSGAYDGDHTFLATIAAIKRGRALERDAAARSHGGM